MTTVFWLYVIVWCLLAYGWVANIWKMAKSTVQLADWGALEVLRVVGIFVAPLGSVLGYIG